MLYTFLANFTTTLISFGNFIPTEIIFLLIIIPICGICLVLCVTNTQAVKTIGLITTILNLFTVFCIYMLFNVYYGDFQLLQTIHLFWPIRIGIDGISLWYVILTGLLMPICLMISDTKIKVHNKLYILCYLFMLLFLNFLFIVLDLIGFYISFEAIIIPMFLIIGIWGSREEKVKASYYFFFYTLGGSVLLLLSILLLTFKYGESDYLMLLNDNIDIQWQMLLFVAFFLSFSTKIPLVPFHIWLPLAHVEAPVAGSVILAGILIKLGTYGFIRFALALTPIAAYYFSPLLIVLSVISIIYASLTTIRQTDLKRIIAYSSVAHMGVATLGIFTFTTFGVEASIFLQVAHGLVSSALFILVTILYEHHHTRLVKYYQGLTLTMPIFSLLFILFTLANIGVPLSANFIGEFLCLIAGFGINSIVGILASTGMVLSACYALFLAGRICFGQSSLYLKETRDMNKLEIYIISVLLLCTLILGVYPDMILDTLHSSITHHLKYLN